MRFKAEMLPSPPHDGHMEGLLWVGEHAYPALLVLKDILDPFFAIRRARVHTETDIALSIIWGTATYSTNYDAFTQEAFQEEPATVEVGVLSRGELAGDPLGYQSVEEVAALIRQASRGHVPHEVHRYG